MRNFGHERVRDETRQNSFQGLVPFGVHDGARLRAQHKTRIRQQGRHPAVRNGGHRKGDSPHSHLHPATVEHDGEAGAHEGGEVLRLHLPKVRRPAGDGHVFERDPMRQLRNRYINFSFRWLKW